jgi:transposase-like protein
MDTHKATNKLRAAHWTRVLQEHAQGKESVKEFCEARGFAPNTYYYWQRKLRETMLQGMSEQQFGMSTVPSGWLRLETSSADAKAEGENAPRDGSSLCVAIDGFRIEIDERTSPELLMKTLRAIKAVC